MRALPAASLGAHRPMQLCTCFPVPYHGFAMRLTLLVQPPISPFPNVRVSPPGNHCVGAAACACIHLQAAAGGERRARGAASGVRDLLRSAALGVLHLQMAASDCFCSGRLCRVLSGVLLCCDPHSCACAQRQPWTRRKLTRRRQRRRPAWGPTCGTAHTTRAALTRTR